MTANREYIYIEATQSLCPHCLKKLDAKIVRKDNKIYIKKNCIEHGEFTVLLEDDAAFHMSKRQYDKPGTASATQTAIQKGCPFDCGLCPQHDQHSCIGLIEVTGKCDMHCPLCFAESGDGKHLSLEAIGQMLDFFVESEGRQAEILQISGGEPTTHPDILEIIKMARMRPIRYVMLNTNGLRIANDLAFVEALAEFKSGFEIYLQFDSLEDSVYKELRGRSLINEKKKAIDNLTRYKIPVTLVTTVRKGLNDNHLASIIDFGIKTKGIRGINIQPEAWFGRGYQSGADQRITLTGVLNGIAKSCNGLINLDDFIPLPCNVERVALTYLYKTDSGFIPITRGVKLKDSLHLINNTFLFTMEDVFKTSGKSLFSRESCCGPAKLFKDFMFIVPKTFFLKSTEEKMDYIDENTFRISVNSFVDAWNFDTKSMQKECVHIITEDLRRIPFSAYNMLYRKGMNA